MARRWFDDPDLRSVPREELLGHLRPVGRYRVDAIPIEKHDNVLVKRYLISGMRRNGVDVVISLRLFISQPSDPHVVLTLPGGGGRVNDKLMLWLARRMGANQAVVDWVGRGQSGSHEGLAGLPDPLFMSGDSFRDCFQFYNVSAIWSALNWLFQSGYRPTDLIGGSWGGVYCFLMAALDPRVERIFSTFGCGGFALPGIEKRSYWDLAIEHMGPARFGQWCSAFDPIVRIADVNAEVYFETATNDKFFSLDMAMETWRRLKRPNFLSLAYNHDHMMGANGVQPYRVQRLMRDDPTLAQCQAASRRSTAWEVKSDNVVCWPLSAEERLRARLVVSEQLPIHGDMSREWRVVEPTGGATDVASFNLGRTRLDSDVLYYLDQDIVSDRVVFKAATPVVGAAARDCGVDIVAPSVTQHKLLDSRSEKLAWAPVGDKAFPKMGDTGRGWSVSFNGIKQMRIMRFGVRPWLLPGAWSSIEVEVAKPAGPYGARLHLVLAKAYNRWNEQAVSQTFDSVAATATPEHTWKYVFLRHAFSPVSVLDHRFGKIPTGKGDIVGSFDAVGIMDLDGGEPFEFSVVSIVAR